MRILLAALAPVLVASCVSVQSAYDSAARRDWGWKPEHGFHEAFANYLVPKIKARYGG